MDIKTMRKVADLRDKGDEIIAGHRPLKSGERITQPHKNRFQALGERIMTAEGVNVGGTFDRSGAVVTGRRYTRTIPLPQDLIVHLEAHTGIVDDYSGDREYLAGVRATWRRAQEPADANTLHVEEVRISTIANPGEKFKAFGALTSLEETLDYVDASIQASQLTMAAR